MRFRIIDQSTDVGNAPEYGGPIDAEQLAVIAGALQTQLDRDFSTYWGGNYVVDSTSPAQTPLAPGEIACLLMDSLPDAPGAVAFHDVNGEEVPIVFLARTQCVSIMNGPRSVSSALSHELCEAAGDPYVNAWRDDGMGKEYAQEACDAVQEAGYEIDGVTVSDFVYPAFFAPGAGGPYSFTGAVSVPLQTMPGGYQLVRSGAGQPTSVWGFMAPHRMEKKRHWSSRTARRGAKV